MKEIEDQGAVISAIRQSMQVNNPELYKLFFETVKKDFPTESYKLVFIDAMEYDGTPNIQTIEQNDKN